MKHSRSTYSVGFKLRVLAAYRNSALTCSQTALRFGIPPQTVNNWIKAEKSLEGIGKLVFEEREFLCLRDLVLKELKRHATGIKSGAAKNNQNLVLLNKLLKKFK